MSKKLLVLFSVLMVAAVALSACGPAATEAPIVSDLPGAGIKICNVNDMGGVDDKSFNATAWKGTSDAMAAFGVDGTFLESEQTSDYEKNINSFLDGTCDLIVGIGFNINFATEAAAIANPDQKFGMIDMAWDPAYPNVAASVYNIDQATFLLGYLAASQTKTGILGTYVGQLFPATAAFMDGFYMGMMKYNEVHGTDVKLIGWDPVAYTGLEVGDFEDVDKGKTITYGLLDEGADIIMPVAGPVGAGTLAAVKERGALMVGVDTDWSVLYADDSEYVLASALKNMDMWLFNTIETVVNGTFTGNTFVGTLDNGGVGISYGVDFKDTIDPAIIAEIADLQAGIIAGTVDYQFVR
ncbi:MAG TPA: BMP family ABC transporter substrate-binding protein [Anaerolineales bacterium]|nr:BMP family ABC transporter substrate-binding protein [Anaerolineales bacterium]